MRGLLCYCRAGFEPELAAELTAAAAAARLTGHARTERGSGHVLFLANDAASLSRALPWRKLVFARQKLALLAELRGLDPRDRITPLLAALAQADTHYGSLLVEHPDSDAAKPLAGLARAFANALRPVLRKAGLLAAREHDRL
ncbi:MAG: 23S rRNA (cytidine(2498)-2'-O)-methyltransferase RlmM, partial [Pseudomonadota bacterium]|nr:23S rRNA (cytidine(2498)-2'-O)-methyltransferase RlmM [Pseudomonadota bacterium]